MLHILEKQIVNSNKSRVDRDISVNGPGLQNSFYKYIQGFKRKCGHYVWVEEESKQRGNLKNETNVNPQSEKYNL